MANVLVCHGGFSGSAKVNGQNIYHRPPWQTTRVIMVTWRIKPK
jgi:hypothetical protein